MYDFDDKYFVDFNYTKKQIDKFIEAAERNISIVKKSDIPELKFQFSYNALLKIGITLVAAHGKKVKSRAGHHIKIIEAMDSIIKDSQVYGVGNRMRRERNTDLYDGGVLISEKEAREYTDFVNEIFNKSRAVLKSKLNSK